MILIKRKKGILMVTRRRRSTSIDPFVVGFDFSTSKVLAIVMSLTGQILKIVSVKIQYVEGLPEGHKEMDPAVLVRAVREVFQKLRDEGIDFLQCRCIAAGGAMHGLCMVDKDGNYGPNIVCWDDARDDKWSEILTTKHKRPIPRRFTGARLLGWLERNPNSAFKPAFILTPAAFVTYLATGLRASLPGDASGMFGYLDDPYEFNNLGPIHTALHNEYDVKCQPFNSMLPRVAKFGTLVGATTTRGNQLFGIPEGIPWAPSGGDQPLGSLGKGCVLNGDVSEEQGSSIVVNAIGFKPILNRLGLIEAMNNSLGGNLGMCCVTNGCQSWDDFVAQEIHDANCLSADGTWTPHLMIPHLSRLASSISPGADGLTFLPFYRPEGALSHPENGVTAGWLGVTRHNFTRAHRARAAMEAPLLILRRALREMTANQDINRIILSGGGAKDKLWPQMAADMFGQSVQIPIDQDGNLQTEAVAYGACLNALCYETRRQGEEITDPAAFVLQHVRHSKPIVPSSDPLVARAYDQAEERLFTANNGISAFFAL